MSNLTLVVLAAGMGNRFGGLKQLAPVDEAGQTLVDYAVFDAIRAGFERVVAVVTPQLEPEFAARIGDVIGRHVELVYAHQSLDALPPGFTVPPGRVKPWGTGQAVLAALPFVSGAFATGVGGAFATVNADDFYGRDAYDQMAGFLADDGGNHGLVGYRLVNTLSEHGTVSRGVCDVDGDGRLVDICERTALRPVAGGAVDEAGDFYGGDTLVSLNFWGFRADAADAFRDGFPRFLNRPDAATAEYFLPDVARTLIPRVRVLPTSAVWMGMTYADDLPGLRAHLASLCDQGVYPRSLWSDAATARAA
ncbi:MAG: NTP transferase domain-containing protein [Propionibacteriaceae bacterium]|nr:NTP transferase domain-containing protein [Propionibacteriaceae bacterium]